MFVEKGGRANGAGVCSLRWSGETVEANPCVTHARAMSLIGHNDPHNLAGEREVSVRDRRAQVAALRAREHRWCRASQHVSGASFAMRGNWCYGSHMAGHWCCGTHNNTTRASGAHRAPHDCLGGVVAPPQTIAQPMDLRTAANALSSGGHAPAAHHRGDALSRLAACLATDAVHPRADVPYKLIVGSYTTRKCRKQGDRVRSIVA